MAGLLGDEDYICAYPVDGRMWQGPNAANIPGVPMVDLLLGSVDAYYRQMIEGRFCWYTAAEQASVQGLLDDGRSMVDAVARTLGIGADILRQWSPEQCAQALKLLPPQAMRSVADVARLARNVCQWNGGHWRGAIGQHVIEAAKHIPPELARQLPVASTQGVSGNALDHAAHIYHTRSKSFIVTVLEPAVRIATPAANDPHGAQLDGGK